MDLQQKVWRLSEGKSLFTHVWTRVHTWVRGKLVKIPSVSTRIPVSCANVALSSVCMGHICSLSWPSWLVWSTDRCGHLQTGPSFTGCLIHSTYSSAFAHARLIFFMDEKEIWWVRNEAIRLPSVHRAWQEYKFPLWFVWKKAHGFIILKILLNIFTSLFFPH